MNVLRADLNEDRTRFRQQLPAQEQPIPQVGEVGMDAQLPGIPVGLDLLRLARQRVVLAVLDVALAG